MTPTEQLAARTAKRNEDNAKFIECAKLLGFEAVYLNGMYKVRHGNQYLGCMDAASWLDHLRNAMIKSNRS